MLHQSSSDHSLFYKTDANSSFTVIFIYVDDLILAGNDINEIDSIKLKLDQTFTIKDLGELQYFLGLELASSNEGIFLSQRRFVLELLQDTGYLASKPASTPLDPPLKLSKDKGVPLENPQLYRKLIGCLQYLITTCLDLIFVTQQLNQYMSDPRDTHL
ncbi:uncharacterized protein LOC114750906 [Neltuma alba]|uniref:uncharacterized protein LOC114750906 n=1 Tax=Neltuma alba TaxID=207710 RepID=UPI0010A32301|nr:uncharacterized protein LOC114750906 [Prosopis alba]